MSVMSKFTIHPKTTAPRKYYQGTELSDVYDRCSDEKRKAYEYCRKLYFETNGEGFAITSHNCQFFTCMWDFVNPDNGRPMRAHITPTYSHAYYL